MQYRGRPSWQNQWGSITFAAILSGSFIYGIPFIREIDTTGLAVIFLAAVLVLIYVSIIYGHYAWTFTVSQDSIESRHGIIARNIRSILVRDLRNINLRQTIFQRLLGIGDLEFSTAGGSGIEVSFFGVKHPMELKEQIQNMQDAAGPKAG